MGRKRLYTDEERIARKRAYKREYKRRKSIERFGTPEERQARELLRIESVVLERCDGFEYAGNYTGSDGTADIRCVKCGTVLTRSWISIRHNSIGPCASCAQIQKENEKAKEQARKRSRTVKAEFVRQARIKQTQMVFCECAECGRLFASNRTTTKYCSPICRTRNNNRVGKDRRYDLIDRNTADMDIDWRPLYKREHGICYLCGEPVDLNDYEWVDGAFIAGNRYPSVDHVVALHDGGTHTWDNVRLAHRLCNSIKH